MWRQTDPGLLAGATRDLVARLELALLAAWRPDTLLARRDLSGTSGSGTMVRWHEGMTKRAGSALVLAPASEELEQAAGWYAQRDRVPLAMVPCRTALPVPARPTPDPEVLVMTADVAEVVRACRRTESTLVTIDVEAPEVLVERTSQRARPGTAPARARAQAVRLLMSAPRQVFSRTPAGSVGRLAMTGIDDTAVIDGIYVPWEARRRGEATAMIETLAAAAAADGARQVALKVEENNDGAVACYLGLGLRTHHRHRYRLLPTRRSPQRSWTKSAARSAGKVASRPEP